MTAKVAENTVIARYKRANCYRCLLLVKETVFAYANIMCARIAWDSDS